MNRSIYFLLALIAVAALTAPGCGKKNAERTVTVPKMAANTDAGGAYDVLHRAGLRVAVSGTSAHRPNGSSIVSRIKPQVGSIVRRGSIVTVNVDGGFLASLTIPKGLIPAAQVPDFSAASLSAVDRWAQKHGLYWQCRRLPPFPASNRPHLFDNYVVVHQSPAPGTILHSAISLPQGGIRLTPVTVSVALTGAAAAKVPRFPDPRRGALTLFQAYERLHDAGFRVSIPVAFSLNAEDPSASTLPLPRAGSIAARGSVATIGPRFGPIGEWFGRPRARIRVPSFAGQPATRAIDWARRQRLFWIVRAPALRAGARPRLLDNYVIAGQTQAPGEAVPTYHALGDGIYFTRFVFELEPGPAS